MDKPTQEQRQKFWERCGFIHQRDRHIGWVYSEDSQWMYPNGTFQGKLPPISLDNIFRWAVPKVLEKIGKQKLVELTNNAVCKAVNDKCEISLTLFWAIWQVIKEEE